VIEAIFANSLICHQSKLQIINAPPNTSAQKAKAARTPLRTSLPPVGTAISIAISARDR